MYLGHVPMESMKCFLRSCYVLSYFFLRSIGFLMLILYFQNTNVPACRCAGRVTGAVKIFSHGVGGSPKTRRPGS